MDQEAGSSRRVARYKNLQQHEGRRTKRTTGSFISIPASDSVSKHVLYNKNNPDPGGRDTQIMHSAELTDFDTRHNNAILARSAVNRIPEAHRARNGGHEYGFNTDFYEFPEAELNQQHFFRSNYQERDAVRQTQYELEQHMRTNRNTVNDAGPIAEAINRRRLNKNVNEEQYRIDQLRLARETRDQNILVENTIPDTPLELLEETAQVLILEAKEYRTTECFLVPLGFMEPDDRPHDVLGPLNNRFCMVDMGIGLKKVVPLRSLRQNDVMEEDEDGAYDEAPTFLDCSYQLRELNKTWRLHIVWKVVSTTNTLDVEERNDALVRRRLALEKQKVILERQKKELEDAGIEEAEVFGAQKRDTNRQIDKRLKDENIEADASVLNLGQHKDYVVYYELHYHVGFKN